MITSKTFGNNGRLGNQLFQYASLIGLAHKYNTELKLPAWEYAKYFTAEFPEGDISGIEIKEPTFHYNEDWKCINENENVDIWGYLQSEKYWKDCESKVKSALTFTPEFKDQVKRQFSGKAVFNKPTIAISIRRGDYVNNPNYELMPITYYILALFENFPEWERYNIIIFSDDIPYCKVHFDCLPNVFFSTNNSDIEDLCLMSQCDNFILSNSTFSWWGAYLAEKLEDAKIIRPNYLFAGKLLQKNNFKDFYPSSWTTFDHKKETGENKKIDLSDCSFTIPVSYDHSDRKENLDLCIAMLRRNFDCEIMVYEQGGSHFEYTGEANWYLKNDEMKEFHRTKMLNEMAKATDKAFVFNWDADVFIAPLQIWLTAAKLRAGADMVYPYEWMFARMPRNLWFVTIRDYEDIGMVGDKKFNGMNNGDAVSVGGAVAFNRSSFIAGGMENEKFISFGAEDVERKIRFEKLGYSVERVPGPLYHMNHFVGVNSSTQNPYFLQNKAEYLRVDMMSKTELLNYVNSWDWCQA